MGHTLEEIAKKLQASPKKVQLIYAFNGVGKTRLSRKFKELIAPKDEDEETGSKILYYNAFTEDLFYWDNDLEGDSERKLIIQPNSFINWMVEEQGNSNKIKENFQHYTSDKLVPIFDIINNQITFNFANGNNEPEPNIKISKGEESNFIWSIFYTLIEQVIFELNIKEVDQRSTEQFNNLKYIFIDDPVSSLDENHLIQLAVELAQLIKSSDFENNQLRFIISTHNPLFYNVLSNELKLKQSGGFMLSKNDDGTFKINDEKGDSNKHFSYHLHLVKIIKDAIKNNSIEKFHFMLLRNLYEKTASFLGHSEWSSLLPTEAKESYVRHIHHFSHKKLSNEEIREPTEKEKQIVNFLLNYLINEYNFWKEEENNDTKS